MIILLLYGFLRVCEGVSYSIILACNMLSKHLPSGGGWSRAPGRPLVLKQFYPNSGYFIKLMYGVKTRCQSKSREQRTIRRVSQGAEAITGGTRGRLEGGVVSRSVILWKRKCIVYGHILLLQQYQIHLLSVRIDIGCGGMGKCRLPSACQILLCFVRKRNGG